MTTSGTSIYISPPAHPRTLYSPPLSHPPQRSVIVSGNTPTSHLPFLAFWPSRAVCSSRRIAVSEMCPADLVPLHNSRCFVTWNKHSAWVEAPISTRLADAVGESAGSKGGCGPGVRRVDMLNMHDMQKCCGRRC